MFETYSSLDDLGRCGVAFAIGILLTVFFPLKLLLFLSSVIIVLLGLIAITKL